MKHALAIAELEERVRHYQRTAQLDQLGADNWARKEPTKRSLRNAAAFRDSVNWCEAQIYQLALSIATLKADE